MIEKYQEIQRLFRGGEYRNVCCPQKAESWGRVEERRREGWVMKYFVIFSKHFGKRAFGDNF